MDSVAIHSYIYTVFAIGEGENCTIDCQGCSTAITSCGKQGQDDLYITH